MTDNRQQRAKQAVRRAGRGILGRWLRSVPVADWPAWAGDLFEIKVPSNVRTKPSPGPEGGANINVLLDLLERASRAKGDLAECGVFRGATLIATALWIAQRDKQRQVFGFDSFQGFDASIDTDLVLGGAEDAEKRQGGFSGTSEAFVGDRLREVGLDRVASLVPGYFERSLPLASERVYCFVHLDCDIYSSYRQCLAYFYPRLSPGGIVLLDEYNDPPWPGCNQAVDEFLADRPETLVPISRDGYEKYYFVKQ